MQNAYLAMLTVVYDPMFGIASRYVKAKIKAPAFNINCRYNPFF